MFRVISRFLLLGLIAVLPVPVALSQSVSFTDSYQSKTGPMHADFNSDGREDFVVGGNGCPDFGLVLSTGNGTYSAPVCYTTPTASRAAVIGDFNGDGYADVIAWDGGKNIYLYAGSATGALHLQGSFLTPTTPTEFAAGDVNNDGKIDLLYVDCLFCGSVQLHVWFGNGKGGFTTGPTTTFNQNATSILIGDFDGDGKADVVTQQGLGASEQVTALVAYGDGAGHFATGPTLYDNSNSVFTAYDVNGDGRMDLIRAPNNGWNSNPYYVNYLKVYYGESNRSFTTEVVPLANCQNGARPTVADFNGDGINDIIVVETADCTGASSADTVDVLLGNGNGTFQPEQVVYSGNNLYSPISFRANPDSKSDFVLYQPPTPNSNGFDAGYIFQNTTMGNFPPCSSPKSYTGITMCSPTSTVVASSPVAFKIGAANQTQGRKIEVWVDGKKLGENLKGAFSYYTFFNTNSALSNGTHHVTVYSAGWDNLLESISFPMTVGTSTCSPPSSPGLNVCSPINNSTLGSSGLAWASGTVTGTISRMEVWVDGVKKSSTYGSNTLKANVTLASGAHRLTYYIVNTAGQKWSQAVSATVP